MIVKRYLALAAVIASLMAAVLPSQAEKTPEGTNPPGETPAGTGCDLTGYKRGSINFITPIPIPDNDPAGVTTPAIVLPDDGLLIQDVVIDVLMSHTWVGDLIATVTYDDNCDGTADASSIILCRPERANCFSGTGFGCPSNLRCDISLLFFSDDAPTSFICGDDATIIPAACFPPSGVGATPLSAFEGYRKGGCWYLNVSDNAAEDIGAICRWSVYVLNREGTPAASHTWGQIKNLYR